MPIALVNRQLSRVSTIHDSKVRCARDDEDGSVYLVGEDGMGYDVVNQTLLLQYI